MSYDIKCLPNRDLADKTFFHPWIGEYYFCPEQNMFGKTKILILGQSHYCKNPERKVNNCNLNCGAMCLCSYVEADKTHIMPNQIELRKKQMGSFFGGAHCNDFTIEVIKAYANNCKTGKSTRWKQDFTQSEKYVLGYQASEEQFSQFWNSVSFYNYVQTAYSDEAKSYDNSYNALELAKGMLQDVISSLMPDVIIAWGLSSWNKQAKEAVSVAPFSLREGGVLFNQKGDKQYKEKIGRNCYYQDIVEMPDGKRVFVLIPLHPSARCVSDSTFEKFSNKCSERVKEIYKEHNPGKEIEW